ncbi:C40 family peptidase [Uliginosibacterium sp. sgz301328]|uniref:C40 family peptidase n=1 Tax=Uliginosibacterium sp. sgz301328 TaxID=3243764 RepID=UPI00359D4517
MNRRDFVVSGIALALAACSTTPTPPTSPAPGRAPAFALDSPDVANEIVLYALGLIDTGYKFGGNNPEAGLDCSGMVAYIVERVSGRRLPHNAAQIASITRSIDRQAVQPADLVFFNTTGQPFSHMGIFLGNGRFVHAPSSRGKVRIENMDNRYFATRYTAARSLFSA